ncbi:hypothetical protein D3C73_711350 [compost metagenome]
MHLCGNDVGAFQQQCRIDIEVIVQPLITDGGGGVRIIEDLTLRHVRAVDFLPVQINDGTVITDQRRRQLADGSRIINLEFFAVIRGSIFLIGIRAIADPGVQIQSLTAAGITERGLSLLPGAVIEIDITPDRSLIRPFIEVFPGTVLSNQCAVCNCCYYRYIVSRNVPGFFSRTANIRFWINRSLRVIRRTDRPVVHGVSGTSPCVRRLCANRKHRHITGSEQ